ncbi:serine kinase [Dyella telluris]|uniref:Serine kinase n=1 Tax=Dyella telluris TaxID=2763498 RepID=A0A7G8Q3E1_9GAMM|nr:serine kinase [Dyella telluris]QNK01299.1 serine kinase [Dyella telluris]
MTSALPIDTGDILADPFGERSARGRSIERWILGARFRFHSASDALLALVDAAYAGLPDHVLGITSSTLAIELRLSPHRSGWDGAEPPPVRMQSGAGLLGGVVDASNYVVMSPDDGRALIVVSEDMLAFPYNLRYELIEFAVFTLATRVQQLIPLHGAGLGRHGRGVLIMGNSGAGKSTLALRGVLEGLEFLAEDAVFVDPRSLRASGVANYLHVCADGLAWVDEERHRRWLGESPTIRRRSGVEKHEVDVRHGMACLAPAPVELAGLVFLSAPPAGENGARLRMLDTSEAVARLTVEQPYAAGQAQWGHFTEGVASLRAYELVRGHHPAESIKALLSLLG